MLTDNEQTEMDRLRKEVARLRAEVASMIEALARDYPKASEFLQKRYEARRHLLP